MIIITTILSLLFIGYTSLLLYYRSSWKSIPIPPAADTENVIAAVFISVIIPARNEEKNILALLESLKQQTYPRFMFEVIVIDDHSTDATASVVQHSGIENVRLIRLKDAVDNASLNSYKKRALETAITSSKGELIVTTDADCIVPPKWLQTIAERFTENNAAMMVMPVVINYQKRFIEIFQALDFMTLQGITGAGVYKKIHGMCNGANLAYTKTAFNEADGFKGIDHIASGDDMLLMQKMTKQQKTIIYIKSEDVIVGTNAVISIKEFFQQRIRWASKADKYEDKTLFPVLLTVYLFNLSLLAGGVAGIIIGGYFAFFICGILILKILAELYFLYPVSEFFKMKKLLWYFPLMQPFHIVYTVIAGWLGKFGSYSWKERKVK
ncbi:MAG: glycosyltransferase [Ferruginibacter sp.]|nr:glycosyltransferase [Ferruginibacter sp.]